ncbi:hypothetical protein OsJ_18193 [Oryza sativa Japonica Group]|uniref:Uncharacterized protein n=1 Tax=Oryza sativa subsp. japonica TaxID=39947 RepID=B9FP34_ORYSJ|nr:hypothetical protein OsJ_18193 [Oryza sativa Japonica Group]
MTLAPKPVDPTKIYFLGFSFQPSPPLLDGIEYYFSSPSSSRVLLRHSTFSLDATPTGSRGEKVSPAAVAGAPAGGVLGGGGWRGEEEAGPGEGRKRAASPVAGAGSPPSGADSRGCRLARWRWRWLARRQKTSPAGATGTVRRKWAREKDGSGRRPRWPSVGSPPFGAGSRGCRPGRWRWLAWQRETSPAGAVGAAA